MILSTGTVLCVQIKSSERPLASRTVYGIQVLQKITDVFLYVANDIYLDMGLG